MCVATFFTGAWLYAAQVPCLLLQEEIDITDATTSTVAIKDFFMGLSFKMMEQKYSYY
jgi:hypothetical protein